MRKCDNVRPANGDDDTMCERESGDSDQQSALFDFYGKLINNAQIKCQT